MNDNCTKHAMQGKARQGKAALSIQVSKGNNENREKNAKVLGSLL
jgi:hypothetical protein